MRSLAIPFMLITLTSLTAQAQEKAADTVIVPLGSSSRIIFTIEDRRDLDILRHYNFQQLFDDIFDKLEGDSTDSEYPVAEERPLEKQEDGDHQAEKEEYSLHADNDDENESDDDDFTWTRSRSGIGRTRQSYNIDLGVNNYLAGDQFPDGDEIYSVRPWGSWYVAINSVQRTKVGRNFFVEWGLGVSWYSFKFQEDNAMLVQDELGAHFVADTRDVDHIKSKLGATFINASLVPVLDFGEHSRKPRIWDGDGDGFRFGIGPYVGYRISSKTKLVYEVGGDREKEKDHDDLFLNNLRYGLRIQIGVRSTDLFINYDMNDLFAENKGPKLNAISFGLIF